MKRPLFVALGLTLLAAAPAYACDADHTAAMMSQITQASAPSNVQAVTLKQKASYCEQNAKNLGLQGNERASYLGACVSRNPAAEQHASAERRI